MSTLLVANVQTGSTTTDLNITTGDVSGAGIVLYTNNSGFAIEGNSSTVLLSANATSNVVLNGALVTVDIQSLTTSSISGTGQLVVSGNVTPTTITSNTSAWNPDSTDIAFNIRLSANAAGAASNTQIYEAYISGLTSAANGTIYTLHNIGSQKIQLRNEDSVNESTAGNRFNIPDHIWLYGFQSMQLIYDGTLARWRPLNFIGASPINSLGYDYDGVVTRRFNHKYSLTKGFASGGTTPTIVTTADRTTYSTEATAAVTGANLSQARYDLGGAGNADKGFYCGGVSAIAPVATIVATAGRTIFSTETHAAVTGANLSAIRAGVRATGNADKGFFSGSTTPALVATADRTNYSTETTAAVSGANLSQARGYSGQAGNADKGFFSGGSTPAPAPTPNVTTADRTNYSTETTAAVSGASLSQARSSSAAGNADKGFFSGGATPIVATADRTTYSSETTAAVAGANLSQARAAYAAFGSDIKGFFAGGATPTIVTTADRTTYSTEATAAVSGANLSQARNGVSGI